MPAGRGRGRGRGRGGSRGSGRGGGSDRGRGQDNNNLYCFNVILLNPGQSSIPRGSTRSELESNGRVKTLEIPRGATPRTTYERLLSLFPELDVLGLFFAFLFPGICFYLLILKLITCQSFSPSSLIFRFFLPTRTRGFEIVRGAGGNNLTPFGSQPETCSARDLNSIRGQGCLYLRLKPSQVCFCEYS